MRDSIIILTSNYPYRDIGSAYEEQEVLFLSKYFAKIYVICESREQILKKFKIPNNVNIYSHGPKRNLLYKVISVGCIFNNIILNELTIIRQILGLKINKKILAILLVEFFNAKNLSRFIKNLIHKEKINANSIIIHSFWNDYRAIAISLVKLKNKEIIAISRAHRGDVYFEENTENYLPLKSFILNNIDGLFGISSHIKSYYENKLKASYLNIFISRLGTFRDFEKRSNLQKTKISNIVLFSCSNIISRKRVDLIAKSLILIDKFYINWTHIGGDYTNGKMPYLIREILLNSKHKVNFWGALDNKELFVEYTNNFIDLFINLSESEGVPVSIMEAMSFGIPIIATAVGGTPEIVKDAYNGFLLSQNPTPMEVAESINKFYFLTEEEKQRMRKNAYKTWNEEYNAEINYKDFAEKISIL